MTVTCVCGRTHLLYTHRFEPFIGKRVGALAFAGFVLCGDVRRFVYAGTPNTPDVPFA